jgi:hypothetical protein
MAAEVLDGETVKRWCRLGVCYDGGPVPPVIGVE